MKRIIKMLLVLIYTAAILLIGSPFLKQALLAEKNGRLSVEEVSDKEQVGEIPFEAVQPPHLMDVFNSDATTDMMAVGQLYIPSLALNYPVFAGISNNYLLYGGGAMYPERDAETENVVIIGHHLNKPQTLFGKLLDIRQGDIIYLKYYGDYYVYQVSSADSVSETETSVLNNTKTGKLTLLTCDTPTRTTRRFVVTAKPHDEDYQITGSKKKELMIQMAEVAAAEKQSGNQFAMLVIMAFLACLITGAVIILRIG